MEQKSSLPQEFGLCSILEHMNSRQYYTAISGLGGYLIKRLGGIFIFNLISFWTSQVLEDVQERILVIEIAFVFFKFFSYYRQTVVDVLLHRNHQLTVSFTVRWPLSRAIQSISGVRATGERKMYSLSFGYAFLPFLESTLPQYWMG